MDLVARMKQNIVLIQSNGGVPAEAPFQPANLKVEYPGKKRLIFIGTGVNKIENSSAHEFKCQIQQDGEFRELKILDNIFKNIRAFEDSTHKNQITIDPDSYVNRRFRKGVSE